MSPSAKTLIAHRGASAYVPEHTLEAYELAVEQGADFIEPDLQITKDGGLICLHDPTLERTTDVAERFPDRYRSKPRATVHGETRETRRWYAVDFTLSELKQLDAGSWFDERFAQAKIPTLDEAIEMARGRAGLYPETKVPELQRSRGFSIESMLIDELARHSLERRGSDPDTPVVIQSFSESSLQIIRDDLGSDLPLALLADGTADFLSPSGCERLAPLVDVLATDKQIILDNCNLLGWARSHGLEVVCWTFGTERRGQFEELRSEMSRFLFELGVDGLFTNNPDLFPREPDPLPKRPNPRD